MKYSQCSAESLNLMSTKMWIGAVYCELIVDPSALKQQDIVSAGSASDNTEKSSNDISQNGTMEFLDAFLDCVNSFHYTFAKTIRSDILTSGPRTTCSAMKPAVANMLCINIWPDN